MFCFLLSRALDEDKWINQKQTRSSTTLDTISGAASISGVFGTLYFKLKSVSCWRLPFLLQPCHVLSALLAYTAFSDSLLSNAVFQIYVSLTWSSVLAFIFPDMSDYEYFWDKVNYWWEHTIMLIVPIYFVSSGRFEIIGGIYWTLLSYVVILSYHFVVLVAVSLITEVNVSTVMSPPSGMEFGGLHYRPIFAIGIGVIHLLYNYFLKVYF